MWKSEVVPDKNYTIWKEEEKVSEEEKTGKKRKDKKLVSDKIAQFQKKGKTW